MTPRRFSLLWILLAVLGALGTIIACATDYVGPDPSATPTARVIIHNTDADHPLALTSAVSSVVSIYVASAPCDVPAGSLDDAYRGTLDVRHAEREFRVEADRHVFLRIASYVETNVRMDQSISCTGLLGGFVPRADESYVLELHPGRSCSAELSDTHGAVVLLHPEVCFASGW